MYAFFLVVLGGSIGAGLRHGVNLAAAQVMAGVGEGYVAGGVEPVLEASLTHFFDRVLPRGWRASVEMRKLLQEASRGQLRRPDPEC